MNAFAGLGAEFGIEQPTPQKGEVTFRGHDVVDIQPTRTILWEEKGVKLVVSKRIRRTGVNPESGEKYFYSSLDGLGAGVPTHIYAPEYQEINAGDHTGTLTAIFVTDPLTGVKKVELNFRISNDPAWLVLSRFPNVKAQADTAVRCIELADFATRQRGFLLIEKI